MSETAPDRRLEEKNERRLADGNRLLFVGGAPRSGTTLVQNVLDSHPDILGTPELLHVPDLLRVHSSFRQSIDLGLLDFFVSVRAVDEAVYGFLDRLLGDVVERADARYVAEKTPSNSLVFAQLGELFPAARFLFVLRDPRAVVSSMLRIGRKAQARRLGAPGYTRSARAAIRTVREHYRSGFDFAGAWPERCQIIRYEDLAAEPEKTTRAMCEFLRLEWTETMTRPHEHPHAGEAAITMTGLWYDVESFRSEIVTDRILSWRTELNAGDQLLVTRAFSNNPALEEAGYRLELDHWTWDRRARAAAGWAIDGTGYRVKRLLTEWAEVDGRGASSH